MIRSAHILHGTIPQDLVARIRATVLEVLHQSDQASDEGTVTGRPNVRTNHDGSSKKLCVSLSNCSPGEHEVVGAELLKLVEGSDLLHLNVHHAESGRGKFDHQFETAAA